MAELTDRRVVADHPRALGRTETTFQVFRLLQVAFVLAPTLAGLDKFFYVLCDWDKYLSPFAARVLGGHSFMYVVGAVEIIAGLIVAVKPRIGGYVVAAWLCGIIANLVLLNIARGGGYWDIALRDFGLAVGAFCLGRLGDVFDRRGLPERDVTRPSEPTP